MRRGLVRFEASEEESTWHQPGSIGNLINYDMPKVEAVHAVADRYVADGRTISAIHFMERKPMCAVVELTCPGERHPAYVVVSWASTMDTESELFCAWRRYLKQCRDLACIRQTIISCRSVGRGRQRVDCCQGIDHGLGSPG